MKCLSVIVAAEQSGMEVLHSDVVELAVAETERSTVLLALIVCESTVDSLSVECPVIAAAVTVEMTVCSLVRNISSGYQHLAVLML